MHILRSAVLLLALLSVWAMPAIAADEPQGQDWAGEIVMGQMKLQFFVRFVPEDDGWGATLDVPIQNLKGAQLTNVRFDDARIEFRFEPPGAPGAAEFGADRSEDGLSATGSIRQFGQEFPLELKRIEGDGSERTGLNRPQTPVPPFPYEQEEVTYTNEVDGVTLAGTLTLPKGSDGPVPAAILITGSGPQDRDETIFEHKPFAVIADHLTRNGIAVLRSDDRGIGGSSSGEKQPDTFDLARDVIAAVEFMRGRPEIDPDRIGLIGHSEGGLIAPMVAAEREDIAFVVLLAGPGISGDQILQMQLATLLRAQGISEPEVEEQLVFQRRLFDLLRNDAETEDLNAAARELVRLQAEFGDDASLSEEDAARLTEMQQAAVQQLDSRWFRTFVKLDPQDSLQKTRCPVLALNGSLDFQVPATENIAAIRSGLTKAGNSDVTAKELDGLNHLFQTAQTGLIDEYMTIEETISTEVLDLMTQWINNRFGSDS